MVHPPTPATPFPADRAMSMALQPRGGSSLCGRLSLKPKQTLLVPPPGSSPILVPAQSLCAEGETVFSKWPLRSPLWSGCLGGHLGACPLGGHCGIGLEQLPTGAWCGSLSLALQTHTTGDTRLWGTSSPEWVSRDSAGSQAPQGASSFWVSRDLGSGWP